MSNNKLRVFKSAGWGAIIFGILKMTYDFVRQSEDWIASIFIGVFCIFLGAVIMEFSRKKE